MEEVHPARGRVHLDRRATSPDAAVVLDDQVAADRLDVDHAAPLLVGECARSPMALGASLVVRIREPEEPCFEIDLIALHVQWHTGGMGNGHRHLLSWRPARGGPD